MGEGREREGAARRRDARDDGDREGEGRESAFPGASAAAILSGGSGRRGRGEEREAVARRPEGSAVVAIMPGLA